MMPLPHRLAERVMEKISPEPNSGCWLWTGDVAGGGYGQISHGDWRKPGARKSYRAHRLVWEIVRGAPAPAELDLCHKCDNRVCVNPDHLFPGTRQDNARDMVAKGRGAKPNYAREFCRHSHEMTPENTFWQNSRVGTPIKRCRACRIISAKKTYGKNYVRKTDRTNPISASRSKQVEITPQMIYDGHYHSFLGKAQLLEGALDAGATMPDDTDGWIESNILALRRLADKMEAAIGRLNREAA